MFGMIKGFILGFAVAVGVVLWFAYTHHVVRTTAGLRSVPRTVNTFEDIYVDVTKWTTIDYVQHREVVKALGTSEFVKARDAVEKAGQEIENEIRKSIEGAKQELDRMIPRASPKAP